MKAEKTIEEFLEYMKQNHSGHSGNRPLDRNLMSPREIYLAEKLVKQNELVKGTAENDSRRKIYYYNKQTT